MGELAEQEHADVQDLSQTSGQAKVGKACGSMTSYEACEWENLIISLKLWNLFSNRFFPLFCRVLYKKADGSVDEEVWEKEEEDDEEVVFLQNL